MAVRCISTRAQICGRGAGCHGGHSAVEQSGYISREKMYSEYDGITYYPKYSEDLVHTEVMLPESAPEEYRDPAVLWNSVETHETAADAQLARTYRFELPNEWPYDLATEVVRDFVRRNFVDKGMCAQFAIHDSENKETGQRNLHCHILLTMRGIDEQGRWMPKQEKIYLQDDNGERIPLIDKKTGKQKVDKQNRKQWKCTTVFTNDWNSKENAKLWRKDVTDTINAVNQKLGMTEKLWEHRSFKDQGLDIIPQIHLGEKASAMERAGIRTIRGDINRDIIAKNAIISAARAVYDKAKEELAAVKAVPAAVVTIIKNEILDMIREVAKRNNNRLKLPIVKGKYIGAVSDRAALQDKSKMEAYVQSKGWSTFADISAQKKSYEKQYDKLDKDREAIWDRMTYLERLIDAYRDYEPYIKYHKEQWALRGRARKQYELKHIAELAYYDTFRSRLKEMIREEDKKIVPRVWQKELDGLETRYQKTQKPYSDAVMNLAKIEVLNHNKRDLERMLQTERHEREVEIGRSRKQGIEI